YVFLTVRAFVFFFFQAEDGIRDRTVTGVQTCALPISSPAGRRAARAAAPAACAPAGTRAAPGTGTSRRRAPRYRAARGTTGSARSEERRVGKEWRARWARDEYKRKEVSGGGAVRGHGD